jgi:alpha-tubulin suppressor-like RCC1 family protein
MLDYNGNIWFWGNKSAVGIEDAEHENQKIPKILLSGVEEGPFTHISTNHSKNLAVTQSGYIIAFGSIDGKDNLKIASGNKEDKNLIKSRSGCKWKPIKSENDVFNTLYVAAGYTNNVIITDKGYPYVWGNNINGRCGVVLNSIQIDVLMGQRKDSDSEEDFNAITDHDHSEGLYIEQPQNVKSLKKLFKRNIRDDK